MGRSTRRRTSKQAAMSTSPAATSTSTGRPTGRSGPPRRRGTTAAGCSVPPDGPGNFYPYWSRVKSDGACALEFGNVSSGTGVDDFGGDSQYGKDRIHELGYPEFEGPIRSNDCPS